MVANSLIILFTFSYMVVACLSYHYLTKVTQAVGYSKTTRSKKKKLNLLFGVLWPLTFIICFIIFVGVCIDILHNKVVKKASMFAGEE